jgi:hypothetical protein
MVPEQVGPERAPGSRRRRTPPIRFQFGRWAGRLLRKRDHLAQVDRSLANPALEQLPGSSTRPIQILVLRIEVGLTWIVATIARCNCDSSPGSASKRPKFRAPKCASWAICEPRPKPKTPRRAAKDGATTARRRSPPSPTQSASGNLVCQQKRGQLLPVKVYQRALREAAVARGWRADVEGCRARKRRDVGVRTAGTETSLSGWPTIRQEVILDHRCGRLRIRRRTSDVKPSSFQSRACRRRWGRR